MNMMLNDTAIMMVVNMIAIILFIFHPFNKVRHPVKGASKRKEGCPLWDFMQESPPAGASPLLYSISLIFRLLLQIYCNSYKGR